MLVLGSSLIVHPAASLVGVAIRTGARVVVIDRGETPYDEAVTMRLWPGIGEVLPPAVAQAKDLLSHRKK